MPGRHTNAACKCGSHGRVVTPALPGAGVRTGVDPSRCCVGATSNPRWAVAHGGGGAPPRPCCSPRLNTQSRTHRHTDVRTLHTRADAPFSLPLARNPAAQSSLSSRSMAAATTASRVRGDRAAPRAASARRLSMSAADPRSAPRLPCSRLREGLRPCRLGLTPSRCWPGAKPSPAARPASRSAGSASPLSGPLADRVDARWPVRAQPAGLCFGRLVLNPASACPADRGPLEPGSAGRGSRGAAAAPPEPRVAGRDIPALGSWATRSQVGFVRAQGKLCAPPAVRCFDSANPGCHLTVCDPGQGVQVRRTQAMQQHLHPRPSIEHERSRFWF